MALTSPTYTYAPELTLVFTYGVNQELIKVPVAATDTLTDSQLSTIIDDMMAQIYTLNPGYTVSCDTQWKGNAYQDTTVTYTP